jgi:hypothetical protein
MATLATTPVPVRADCSVCELRRLCQRDTKEALARDLPVKGSARDFTYISFGAGVQSTALLVMSNLGLLGCPRADVAIFADTQGEPHVVYDHLSFMEKWSAIPVIRVTTGNLALDIQSCLQGKRKRVASIPAWTKGKSGRPSPLWRQCTMEYKVAPIVTERLKMYHP